MTQVSGVPTPSPAPAPVTPPPASSAPPAATPEAPTSTTPAGPTDTASVSSRPTGPLQGNVDFTDAQANRALGKVARALAMGNRQDKEKLIAAFCQQMGITRDDFDDLANGDLQLSHEQLSHLTPDQKQELSQLGSDPNRVNAYIDHQAANLEKGTSC